MLKTSGYDIFRKDDDTQGTARGKRIIFTTIPIIPITMVNPIQILH